MAMHPDRKSRKNTPIIVVMGVSGTGKTTIGRLLAAALGCVFVEGDDLHPCANVAKMAAGTPLDDADRLPWLRRIAVVIDFWRNRSTPGVLSCSALKRSYRDIILGDRTDVTLVYLRGGHDLVQKRLAARHGHFMPATLLDSQLASLHEPQNDEDALVVDVSPPPPAIVEDILQRLGDRRSGT